jgi:hypothetical protein
VGPDLLEADGCKGNRGGLSFEWWAPVEPWARGLHDRASRGPAEGELLFDVIGGESEMLSGSALDHAADLLPRRSTSARLRSLPPAPDHPLASPPLC